MKKEARDYFREIRVGQGVFKHKHTLTGWRPPARAPGSGSSVAYCLGVCSDLTGHRLHE